MPKLTAVQLSDFPRPNVAVDLAVLSVRPTERGAELVTLVQQRFERPRGDVLPGRFIREGETIADTVTAILRDKLDISASSHPRPRLLRVFDEPRRDERGWTISIGHSLALPWCDVEAAVGDWRPVTSRGSAPRDEAALRPPRDPERGSGVDALEVRDRPRPRPVACR